MNNIVYLECRDGIHNKFYLMTAPRPLRSKFYDTMGAHWHGRQLLLAANF